MPENDLEKNIKELMENFQLTPRDSVWDKVSRKIYKKDKRRILPFFLMVTALAVCGYFFFHTTAKLSPTSTSEQKNENNKSVNRTASSEKDKNSIVIKKTPENNLADSNAVAINKTWKNNVIPQFKNPWKRAAVAKPKDSHLQKNNLQTESKIKQDETLESQEQFHQTLAVNNKEQSENDDIALLEAQSGISDSAMNINIMPADLTFATVKQSADSALNQTAKSKLVKPAKIKKWQYGITAFYGKSNAAESLVDFNKSYSDYSANPAVGVNGRDSLYSSDNVFSSSHTFYYGGFVQRKVSSNSFVGIGLNFIHLSLKTNVTEKINSFIFVQNTNGPGNLFVSSYYRPGVSKRYLNIYNFLEMPVTFQHNFIHRNKFSVSYDAGITVRQYLSSRSLVYDPNSNVYFTGNNEIRKTQLQLSTGFNFNINKNKSSLFSIGPQFSYSMSDLFKNNTSNNFHFISYGLKGNFFLNKK